MPSENFVFNTPIRIIYTNSLIAAVPFRNEDGTQGAPRFNLQALIPPDHPQLAEFQRLVLSVAQKGLPAHVDANGVWTHVGLGLPLKSGDRLIVESAAKARAKNKTPPDRSFYTGQFVLFAQKPEKSRAGGLLVPPGLVVRQPDGQYKKYEDNNRVLAKEFFYNGVLAAVSVQLKEYPGFGGGVTAYLDRVLSMNVGDKIEMGRDDESVFGASDSYNEYVGHATTESPTAGMVGGPAAW